MVNSLHESLLAHQAGAYPGFHCMKRLEVLVLHLDGMLVHLRVTPNIKFACTYFSRVERETMRIKCLAQEHNAVPWPVRPDPESSALNIKPPRLPTRHEVRSS